VFSVVSNSVLGLQVKGDGRVGIGTGTPISGLHVKNGASGWFPTASEGIVGECGTSGCAGVMGLSASGPGIFGLSHNSLQPGVRAVSAFSVDDLALQVWGKAEVSGVLNLLGNHNPGFYSLVLPNFAVSSGRGLANRWDTYSSRRWKTN